MAQTEVDSTFENQKRCPFCAESVKVEAVYCRYCHKDLPPSEVAGALSAPSPLAQVEPSKLDQELISSAQALPVVVQFGTAGEGGWAQARSGFTTIVGKRWSVLAGLLAAVALAWCFNWPYLLAGIGFLGLLAWPVLFFAVFLVRWRLKLVLLGCSFFGLILCFVCFSSPVMKNISPDTASNSPTVGGPTSVSTAPDTSSDQAENARVAAEKSEYLRQKAAAEDARAKELANNLGCSEAQFVQRFNDAANSEGLEIRMKKSKEKPVPGATIYTVGPNMALTIIKNQTAKKVRSIMFVGSGDDTFTSGAQVLFAMGLLMTSADPTIGPDERHEIMTDLHIFSDDGKPTIDGKSDRNGLHYEVGTSQIAPVLFTVTKIE